MASGYTRRGLGAIFGKFLLERAVQPWHSCPVPIPEETEQWSECGTWGHGLVLVLGVLGEQLDSVIIESWNGLG